MKHLSEFEISVVISCGLGRSKMMSIVCLCNVVCFVSQFRREWSLASAKADNWQTCCSWIPTWDLVILTTSKSRSYEREVSRYINMARIFSSKWHHYDKDFPFIQSPVVASLSSFTLDSLWWWFTWRVVPMLVSNLYLYGVSPFADELGKEGEGVLRFGHQI